MLWMGPMVGSTHVITFPVKDYGLSCWCVYLLGHLVVLVYLFSIHISSLWEYALLDVRSRCPTDMQKTGDVNRFYIFLNFLTDISSRLDIDPTCAKWP